LISTYDNTNSLHTNAYGEAITTPTKGSVRCCSLGQITNALFEVGGQYRWSM
jgi:methylmalonyl-CoA mutase N-terminal domain/subunit